MEITRRETDRPHVDGYEDDAGHIFATKGDGEYVDFGSVSRALLGQQCQYASRFVSGYGSDPDLGKGLRFDGEPQNYHTLGIHPEDVQEFVQRANDYHTAATGEVREIVDGRLAFRLASDTEVLQAQTRLREKGIDWG